MKFIQWTNTAFAELEILPQAHAFEIIRRVDFLAQFPEMGVPLESRFPRFKKLRQLIIKRNIRVVYEFDENKETIFVLAVQNCRQKISSTSELKRRKRQID